MYTPLTFVYIMYNQHYVLYTNTFTVNVTTIIIWLLTDRQIDLNTDYYIYDEITLCKKISYENITVHFL